MIQAPRPRTHSTRQHGLIIVGITVICFIAVFWAMSNLGFAPNFWISIFVPITTGAGLVIGLLQFFMSESPHSSIATNVMHSSNNQQNHILFIGDILLILEMNEGAIVVLAKKPQLALNVSVSCGFSGLGTQPNNSAICVTKRRLFVCTYYIIFSPLKSGDYTIHSQFTGRVAMVKVVPGHHSEIDWRN